MKPIAIVITLVIALLAVPLMVLAQEAATQPSTAPTTSSSVLNATDIDALKAAVGKDVAVRGKVSGSYKSGNSGIILLNFEGANRDFVALIEKDNADAVNGAFGGDVASLKDKTITITGPVKLYRDKPEIVISKPEQIKVEAAEDNRQ